MKTLFILLASILSNSLISNLFRNTAKPLLRTFIRRAIRYSAKVFSVCLIGSLTFVAGLVMTSNEMASQLMEAGGLSYTPAIGFGVGLLILGAVFVYVGAFSHWLSPWRRLEVSDSSYHQSTGWGPLIDVFMSAMQEGAKRREEDDRRQAQENPEQPSPKTEERSQTGHYNYQEPIH
jgi:hypothetical protein